MYSGRAYYTYIMASGVGGTLYVGTSNDLVRRVHEHRTGTVPGFTRRYRVHRLVYFEKLDTAAAAIAREKRLKKYNREWKIRLVEENNPDWHDLYPSIAGA